MNRYLALSFIALLISCKEEITPLVKPNNNGGGGSTSTPLPTSPVSGKYANCLSILSESTLDVVTWNIENFPQNSSTVTSLTEMISTMDADIIAVQEIVSTTNFNLLVSNLQEYSGSVTATGQQKLGFIYKPTEILSFEPITELFKDDACAFPRPALKTKVKHKSGAEITIINVHLKCCDDSPTSSCLGGIERRRQASVKLKSYIDQNLANEKVIVLGDWNDDITQPEGNDVFINFINDATNYKFTDMSIATGNKSNFSYQGTTYTSHLDHILVTNELFNNIDNTRTIVFSNCENQYKTNVSDHFPVILRLKDLN